MRSRRISLRRRRRTRTITSPPNARVRSPTKGCCRKPIATTPKPPSAPRPPRSSRRRRRSNAARINLGYANVTAPISGRAGQQQVTEGALVGQGDATLLTTVEQIDPIYVNFSQAVGEIDTLRAQRPRTARATGRTEQGEDRNDAVPTAAPTAQAVRSIFPTPPSMRRPARSTCAASCRIRSISLLPGQFVNVRVTLGELNARVADSAARRCSAMRTAPSCSSSATTARSRRRTIKTDALARWRLDRDRRRRRRRSDHRVRPAEGQPGAPAKATPWTPKTDKAKGRDKAAGGANAPTATTA